MKVALAYVAHSVRRDWRIALTHRAPFLFDALGLLAGSAVFYYLGRYQSRGAGHVGLFAFAVAGLSVLRLNSALPRVVLRLDAGLGSGTFELLLSSPRSPASVILGESAFELLRGFVLAAGSIVVAVLAFGAPVSGAPAGLLGVACGLGFGLAVFAALAALTAALMLVMRQAGALATLGTILMPLLAGAYFPVRALPQPLEGIASVLPFRAAVQLIRRGLLDGVFDWSSAAALVGGTAVFVPLSYLAFHRAVDHARRASTLGHS